MINVVLQLEVLGSRRGEDRKAEARAIDEEAGDIAAVDRLHEKAELRRRQFLGRRAQVLDQRAASLVRRHPGRRDPGQTIEFWTVQRLGVVDRLRDAIAKFRDAIGLAGHSPFAPRPVARGEVMENELETIVLSAPRRCRAPGIHRET